MKLFQSRIVNLLEFFYVLLRFQQMVTLNDLSAKVDPLNPGAGFQALGSYRFGPVVASLSRMYFVWRRQFDPSVTEEDPG